MYGLVIAVCFIIYTYLIYDLGFSNGLKVSLKIIDKYDKERKSV